MTIDQLSKLATLINGSPELADLLIGLINDAQDTGTLDPVFDIFEECAEFHDIT